MMISTMIMTPVPKSSAQQSWSVNVTVDLEAFAPNTVLNFTFAFSQFQYVSLRFDEPHLLTHAREVLQG